jgi:hypothetical protein
MKTYFGILLASIAFTNAVYAVDIPDVQTTTCKAGPLEFQISVYVPARKIELKLIPDGDSYDIPIESIISIELIGRKFQRNGAVNVIRLGKNRDIIVSDIKKYEGAGVCKAQILWN